MSPTSIRNEQIQSEGAAAGDVLTADGSGAAEWVTPAPAGQYRQFVYEVSGGDFAFVIDELGNPVMALEDFE